jgi:hypothetical protein
VSAAATTVRELIALAGPVQCEQPGGAVNLVLRGHADALPRVPLGAAPDAGAGSTEVLFSGATQVTLPAGLHDVRVFELFDAPDAAPSANSPDANAARHFRLQGPQLLLEWHARSVQLQRDAAAPFYRALPPPRVPLRLRLGWSLLLAALRLPGAATLIGKIRGAA